MARLKGNQSNVELLRTIIENTINEVYEGELTERDVANMADALLDEERNYLIDLRIKIETHKESEPHE